VKPDQQNEQTEDITKPRFVLQPGVVDDFSAAWDAMPTAAWV